MSHPKAALKKRGISSVRLRAKPPILSVGFQGLHFESGEFPEIIRAMKGLLIDDHNLQLLLEDGSDIRAFQISIVPFKSEKR